VIQPIQTRVAHTAADELRFRGRKVFADLLGRTSAAQMLVLGISERLLTREEAVVIDDIVTVMSSADPRLWPFKITRLGSAHGTGACGVAATLIAGEGGMYGTNRLLAAARWLVELEGRSGALSDDELLASVQGSSGAFGVVYRARDERFDALLRQVEARGRHEQPFIRLVRRATRVARDHTKLEPHVYLAIAALCLDLGLATDAVAVFGLLPLFHDALANAAEGALQQPSQLQALPLATSEYRGISARRSPRAIAAPPEPL